MTSKEMELFDRLVVALTDSWSAETSSDPDGWSPDNPAWGQCAVTALVVQDHLGGDLLRSETFRTDRTKGPSHYFNGLPGSVIIDLTRRQFKGTGLTVAVPELRTRQEVLAQYPRTLLRYGRLAESVATHLLAQTP